MKLVIIMGPHAVGKMTVGQELAKITGFKLLHNHMTIEFVNQFFDPFLSEEGHRLRLLFMDEILTAAAGSDLPGLIYTTMVAFDMPSERERIKTVVNMFEAHGAEVYAVELCADFDVRIGRNTTENRLLNKPTKRDLERSERAFRDIEATHRLGSLDGEIPVEKYIKIDNTHLPPHEVAAKINGTFALC